MAELKRYIVVYADGRKAVIECHTMDYFEGVFEFSTLGNYPLVIRAENVKSISEAEK